MARDGDEASTTRPWALFVGALGLALALLLPLLGALAIEGVDGGVALVALAAAMLLTSGPRYVVLVARTVAVRIGGPSDLHIRLNGNITDPPHHPVRPRAPGLA